MSVAVHVVLALSQLTFILTLPLAYLLPVWAAAATVAAFLLVNWALCTLLNGPSIVFHSDPECAPERLEHAHEQWVFLNGVAVG